MPVTSLSEPDFLNRTPPESDSPPGLSEERHRPSIDQQIP